MFIFTHYTLTMRTTVRLNNQVLTDAKQDKLEQTFKTLPTRALGKPLLKVDFSSNASIQEMLDKELAVKPLSTGK
jgi:hypothetical protein